MSKSVAQIVEENKSAGTKLEIIYDKQIDTVSIEGTKEGLIALAKILEAQANDLGNQNTMPSNCLTIVSKQHGIFTEDSVKQLQIHRASKI